MSNLIERLQEAMAERGIDQSMLARRLGVSQGTISKIMRGKTVNSRHLPRIAAELDVSLGWLMGTDDSWLTDSSSAALDRELISLVREMPAPFRAVVLQLSRSLAQLLDAK